MPKIQFIKLLDIMINHIQQIDIISSMWFFMENKIKYILLNFIHKITIIKIIFASVFILGNQPVFAQSGKELTNNASNYISSNGASFELTEQQIEDFVEISSSQFRNQDILSENERSALKSISNISLDGGRVKLSDYVAYQKENYRLADRMSSVIHAFNGIYSNNANSLKTENGYKSETDYEDRFAQLGGTQYIQEIEEILKEERSLGSHMAENFRQLRDSLELGYAAIKINPNLARVENVVLARKHFEKLENIKDLGSAYKLGQELFDATASLSEIVMFKGSDLEGDDVKNIINVLNKVLKSEKLNELGDKIETVQSLGSIVEGIEKYLSLEETENILTKDSEDLKAAFSVAKAEIIYSVTRSSAKIATEISSIVDSKGPTRQLFKTVIEAVDFIEGSHIRDNIYRVEHAVGKHERINENLRNIDIALGSVTTDLKKDIGLAIYRQDIPLTSNDNIKDYVISQSVNTLQNEKLINARKELSQKSQAQQRVVESLKASTQKLESLSKQINNNQSKIRLLEKELASLSGSSSSSRISQAQIRVAKIRELRLKMFWNLYNKYDGDLSKVSSNDKIRLHTLAKSFDGSWKELFVDAPALYESAKQERIRLVSVLSGSGSDKARTLQNKIKNLQTKVTILANAAQKKETEYRSLFSQYQSNQSEIASLISDINDTAKEDIASSNNPALTNPFYGNVSYLGNGATTGTFEGYFAASTSNDFSSSNQNTSFRAGNANEFISPDISTGSGNHFTDGYRYVAWGQWNSNGHQIVEGADTNNALGGYWVLGQQAYNVPTQGSASYSGDMKGDYINSAGNAERGAIGGTIGFNVNFGQSTIAGNGSLTLHNNPLDTFNFNPVNLGNVPSSDVGGIDTSYWFYTNQVNTGSGQNMNIAGSLNGDKGSEISGSFVWGEGNANSANSASGILRAQCTGGVCQ